MYGNASSISGENSTKVPVPGTSEVPQMQSAISWRNALRDTTPFPAHTDQSPEASYDESTMAGLLNSTGELNSTGMESAVPDLFDLKAVSVSFSVVYCVIWLFCVVGNVLVLLVMKGSPSLHSRTNLFLSHLAVADLGVGLVCIIPNLVHAHMVVWFPGPLGHFFCKLYNFVEEFNLTVSVLLLVLIATDRYVAISQPLRARRLFTRRRMYFALLLVWVAASAYNAPMLFVYTTVVTTSGNTYCYRAWDVIDLPLYTALTAVFTYVIPLICMTAMYVRISVTLWRSSAGSPSTGCSRTPASRLNAHRVSSPHQHLPSLRRQADVRDAADNIDNREVAKTSKNSADHHHNIGLALVPKPDVLPPKDNIANADDNHPEDDDNDDSVFWSCSDSGVECLRVKCKSSARGSNCICSDTENCSRCSHNSRTSGASRSNSDTTSSASSSVSSGHHTNDNNDRCRHYSAGRRHAPRTLELKLSNSSNSSGGSSGAQYVIDGANNIRPTVVSRSSSVTSSTPLMPSSALATPLATSPSSVTSPGANVTSSLLPVSAASGGGDGVYTLRRGNSAAGSCRLRVTSHRALVTRRKVVRMLIVVLVVFALTVFPHHMRAICRYYLLPGKQLWLSGVAKYMVQVLLFLNSALNPVLYSLMSDSFRRGARGVLCPKPPRRTRTRLNVGPGAGEAAFRDATARRLPGRSCPPGRPCCKPFGSRAGSSRADISPAQSRRREY